MNKKKAYSILSDSIREDGSLYNYKTYLFFDPKADLEATLDGDFTLEELEALVWYMKQYEK